MQKCNRKFTKFISFQHKKSKKFSVHKHIAMEIFRNDDRRSSIENRERPSSIIPFNPFFVRFIFSRIFLYLNTFLRVFTSRESHPQHVRYGFSSNDDYDFSFVGFSGDPS